MRLQDELQRARAGDAAAVASLLERLSPRVRELAHGQLRRRCRGEHRALAALSTGDLAQDVLLEVFTGLDHWEGDSEEQFAGLLATLVEYRLLDLLRRAHAGARDERRQSGVGAETAGVADPQRSPATIAMDIEQLRIYREVLTSFGDRERVLLVRRFEEGDQFADLANALAYPSADAARKAFHTAHARLLLRLRQRGIAPPGDGSRDTAPDGGAS